MSLALLSACEPVLANEILQGQPKFADGDTLEVTCPQPFSRPLKEYHTLLTCEGAAGEGLSHVQDVVILEGNSGFL
jgi:hypothetical protein